MPRILLRLLLLLTATHAVAGSAIGNYFVTSDGVRLHYLEEGSGPAIIFQPGWLMTAEIWQPQIEYFSRSYHVIAVDPRSQGESDKTTEGDYPERRARDIQELVAHLHLAPAVLVGWSLGVTEVLDYVDQFGTKDIRALVLVDGLVWDKPDPQLIAGMLPWVKGVETDRQKFVDKFVRSMFKTPQTEDYILSVEKNALKTPSSTAFALLMGSLDRSDWTPVLLKIDKPVLALSSAGRGSMGKVIKAHLPNAQIEEFEDAGHALFVDDAARFNTTLEKFLTPPPKVGDHEP